MPRQLPNILITGTPGVGKTTTATQLASLSLETPTPLSHIPITEIAKSKDCHESYDDRLKTWVLDEDKLLDVIEEMTSDGETGGFIIDYHDPALFPDRWIDLVVVLRCSDTGVFYERLAGTVARGGRGYEGDKLQENIDAEIFGVVRDEAFEGYPGDGRCVELESVGAEDVEGNCERVLEWVSRWVEERQGKEGE